MKWIAMLATVALTACNTMTPIKEARPVQLSGKQVAQIQRAVVRDFKDPGSAQFRDIRAVDVTLQNGARERRVCGEVNGKNSYGAYVGFEMFGGLIENGQFVQRDFFAPCEAW